ncbi:MAG TPA: hypothetical protein VHJ76_01845, partial [Actinomycetota bacterium]|nr:hypothetical protein [Actinomycetota bacterium]
MSDPWKAAPGATRSVRPVVKKLLGSFLVGAMSIGLAWAGQGLVPVGSEAPLDDVAGQVAPGPRQAPENGSSVAADTPQLDLSSGQVLAGAAKVSLKPEPAKYGGVWEQDYDKCANLAPNQEGV